MNILLTSAGRRGYLVKYFREALSGKGFVHVGNSSPVSPAFAYADYHVVTPLIYDDNYIPFLLQYCKKNDIKAIISLFDIDLYVLASHKKEFSDNGITVIVSETDVISVCNDKWNTYNFLKGNGFNAPLTYISKEDFFTAYKNGMISFPVIVKPRWGMGSIGVYIADNKEELDVFYAKVKRDIASSYLKYESTQDTEKSVLIQQMIDGQEYGLDVINDLKGNYKNTIVRMKYAMRSGETDCALIVDNEKIKAVGEKLSATLKHIGNLDSDVFVSNDNNIFVLELNARFGGGYPFSHMAGVNLPKTIINWLNNCSEEYLCAKPGVLAQKDITMLDITNFLEESKQ